MSATGRCRAFLYVDSDVPDEDGYNFFKFDKAFNVLGKWSFGWFQGVEVVPGGKDGATRFFKNPMSR